MDARKSWKPDRGYKKNLLEDRLQFSGPLVSHFSENAPFSIFGSVDEKRVGRSIILLVFPVEYISNKRHQYPLTIETKEHHKSPATHSLRRKSFCKILNLPHPCKRPEEFSPSLSPCAPGEMETYSYCRGHRFG
ncbi:hypothetical protein CEXT_319131 [Caerostris extrusa]|uniref:Uncharacterized protein n=1 Tax=Caerostris extrusa TaxID=172846 RepID=A0AAV4PEV0_CAEEX|nr:hypothetical protein CEXT_319131 [Caerostris extrusa]